MAPNSSAVEIDPRLLRQLEAWVRAGTIEMSCGSSIAQVAASEPPCAPRSFSKQVRVFIGPHACAQQCERLQSL